MAQFFGFLLIILSVAFFALWLRGSQRAADDTKEAALVHKDSDLDRKIEDLKEQLLVLKPELKEEISKPFIPDILNQQAVDKILATYRERPGIIKKYLLLWNLESHGKLDARIIDSQTQRIEAETRLYRSATEKEKARQEYLDLRRTLSITERQKKIQELKQELEIERLGDEIDKVKQSRQRRQEREAEQRRPQREDYEI